MKYCVCVALLLACFMPSVASAQKGDSVDTPHRFYDFGQLLINGRYHKPQMLYTDARQKVKFDRLLELKKPFIQKIHETSKDTTLR